MGRGCQPTPFVWHAALARACRMGAGQVHPHCAQHHKFLGLPSSPARGHVVALTGSGWIPEQSVSGQQRARLSSDTLGKVVCVTLPK